MIEILEDTLVDAIKLLPFLIITYLIMEYIEHKMAYKSKEIIKKSGKFGPIIGAILGAFPQCGFSVSATNLYAGRVITLGTLISVYLSTSDEMLPIFISEAIPVGDIFKILFIKVVIGFLIGIIVDVCLKFMNKNKEKQLEEENIKHICEEEHCNCGKNGILKSAIKHTANIFAFIVIINFVVNLCVEFVGEDIIKQFILNKPLVGPIIASLIGLIPNCAASVIITNMYLENVISFGSMMAGLLTGAGVGLAVLFKVNDKIKQNINIVTIIYLVGVVTGIIVDCCGFLIKV